VEVRRVVRGDVLKIELGKSVAADVRVVRSNGIRVDDSALTGEHILKPKDPTITNQNYIEARNMIMRCSICREGEGWGVVVGTGYQALIGQILPYRPLRRELPEQSLIHVKLRSLLTGLAIIYTLLAGLFLGWGFAVGYPFLANFHIAIGILTAGATLQLASEIALSINHQKISKSSKIKLQRLDSLEILGAVSCICMDDTGTLTGDKLAAASLWYNGKIARA
jgi:magnesium-transporting ATPase (P-type)